jgi:hypothetical protein
MADPVTLTAAGIALKATKWAWDHQDEIEPKLKVFFRNTRRRVFGRHPGILILGPGGTGKTTLGRIMSGKYDFLLDGDSSYQQTIGVQTFLSKKNSNVEVIVGPGQEDRRHATWPKLLNSLANGKELGVILCCAYGHHSLSISYKHHKVYNSERPKDFMSNFTSDRRLDEIRVLDEVCSALEQNANQTWLLTLVAKEDLWTEKDKAVHDFYTTGEYGKRIQALITKKGNRLFRHEIVFGSMVIHNLTTARGELLQKNTAGYDHTRQVQSLRQMIETVSALENWKAK